MRLIADIGGTNARFALVDPLGVQQALVKLAVVAYPAFDDALDAALAQFGNPRVREAVLAVAGPIRAGMVALTNADWLISEHALAARLGTGSVRLVNDFEAVALAIPHLQGDDLQALGEPPGPSDARLPRLALGPGTGLGAALWVPLEHGGYRSVATEAGHMSLACDDPALRGRLQASVGQRPLEAEDVLSGAGIARLHEALHQIVADPSAVTAAAAGADAAARATLDCFADLLARFAAEAALVSGAFGGVYIGGGLIEAGTVPLDGARMRRVFDGQGRMAHVLRKVPLYAVRRIDSALLGLARVPLA
ncbi:MAG: ROK family protein [Burkholderiaceae bacterium]